MRSVILLSLSVFAVIVTITYCITWYLQVSALESAVKEAFARLNETQQVLTYESIETGGFPDSVTVTITRPHFKGRMDTFLTSFTQSGKNTLPPWDEDSLLDGTISFSLNIFGNQYSADVSGNWTSVSTISGKTFHMTTTPAGNSHCDLQFANRMGVFSTLWDFHSLAERKGSELFSDFRLLDCHSPGYTVTDPKNGPALMGSGPMRLFISSEEAGAAGARDMRAYMKLTDSEVTPAGDDVFFSYMTGLFPGSNVPTKLSAYGKKNAELDMSYSGPVAVETSLGSTPVAFHINHFSFSNLAYQTKGNVHFTNGGNSETRDTKLNFNFESSYEEPYDALLQEMVRGFILQLYSPFVPQPADLQPLIRKHNADSLFAIIEPAIPNLHSLGRLVQSLDFTYSGNPDISAGDITFTNLDLSAAIYGLTGRGSIKLTEGQLIPAMNVILNCNNCLRLIDDVTSYAQRVEHALAALNGEKAPVALLSTPQTDGLKAFLSALAAQPENAADKTVFEYHIVSSPSGSLSINDKPLVEVMAIYNQTIAPAMQGDAGLPALTTP